MVLEKLKGVADMFLNCLNDIPEQCSGEATIILQDLIQKAMVKLSKGKIRTIIFEAVKESALGGNVLTIEQVKEPEQSMQQHEQLQQQQSDQVTQVQEVMEPPQTFTVTPIQQNQELDNWVNAMLYEEPAEDPPSPAEPDDTSNITVSMTTETVVTQSRTPGRPRKHPGPSIVDKYNIAVLSDGTKLFVCGLCDKQFKDKSNIGRHLKAHVGDRSFPCPFCQTRFTQKVHMQSHMRIHTGERPFKCQICEKTFATRRSLDQHNLVHSQVKRFKCEICDRAFAFKQKLQMHMQIHTGKKPYTCQLCNKGFCRNEILKSHKCAAVKGSGKGSLTKVIKLMSPESLAESSEKENQVKAGKKKAQLPRIGRPPKTIKIEKVDKNEGKKPKIKKEEESQDEIQTISIQTPDGGKQQAVMKPVRMFTNNPNEICFEIIAQPTNTQETDNNSEITIIETQLEGEPQLNEGEDNSATIVHDISSLPESLQALVQAATSVSSSSNTLASSSETEVLAPVERKSDTVIEIIAQPETSEASGLVELDTQNVVVSTVEEIVEEKS